MKATLASLILLGVAALNTIAQDTSRWGLPEGAKARFGRGTIYEVKYSPDGTRLAAASSIGVWFYDSTTRRPVSLLRDGNTFKARSIAYSPDGHMLAVAAEGFIGVWDAVTGELKNTLRARYGLAWHIAFSSDGRTIASGAYNVLRLWDAVTGELKHTMTGERFGDVESLAFSPDGRILASGHWSASAGHSTGSTKIRLWDAATGELQTTLTDFRGLPTSLCFNRDGRTLASGLYYWHIAGEQSGTINLWDVETWELKLELSRYVPGARNSAGVLSIAYSPDGRMLASGTTDIHGRKGEDGTVHLWDAVTGTHIRTLKSHAWRVRSIAFSRDGRTLAIASSGNRLSLWDVATGTQKSEVEGRTVGVSRVAFSRDGRTIAGGSWDNTIRLWDSETGSHKYTLKGHTNSITNLVFSPVGNTLASGSKDTTIRLWNADTGVHKRTLENVSNVPSMAFSPDGRRLASGGGVLRLYDVATGMHIRTLNSPIDGVYGVAYSSDGRTIAGSNAREIRLWNAVTGAHIHTLDSGRRITFSPDSRTLAAVRPDEIQLWDVGTGGHRGTLDLPEAAISDIAFTRDGRTLAVGHSTDPYDYDAIGTLRVWDAVKSEHIRTLEGHTGDVLGVAFSPDGGTIVSASTDGTVLQWEINVDVEEAQVEEPFQMTPDVNGDGSVDIRDLVLIAGRIGKPGENREDVNGDGIVNILDLVLVAGLMDNAAGAPLIDLHGMEMLRTTQVRRWLEEARRLDLADTAIPRGIEYLRNLLEALTPERTRLLPNYPNPFNPETWIPYQLARESVVRISIYSSKGILVRQLDVGLQAEGFYTDKHHAAYWDGRNDNGELLASGLYIYVFRAGSYRASRRMAIVR